MGERPHFGAIGSFADKSGGAGVRSVTVWNGVLTGATGARAKATFSSCAKTGSQKQIRAV